MTAWMVICRVDIPVLGARRVAREQKRLPVALFRNHRRTRRRAARPLPAQGRPAVSQGIVFGESGGPPAATTGTSASPTAARKRPTKAARRPSRARSEAGQVFLDADELATGAGAGAPVANGNGLVQRPPAVAMAGPVRSTCPTAASAAASSSRATACRSPACAATRPPGQLRPAVHQGQHAGLTGAAPAPAARATAAAPRMARGQPLQPVAWDAALDELATGWPHRAAARARRGSGLYLSGQLLTGDLRLQQAGQGPARHQQRRHQLAAVHEHVVAGYAEATWAPMRRRPVMTTSRWRRRFRHRLEHGLRTDPVPLAGRRAARTRR